MDSNKPPPSAPTRMPLLVCLSPVSWHAAAAREIVTMGQCTKSLCDRGNLSACVLTRLEIADSGAWRPVLRIEVLSTSSKTGVSHEYGYRQPAASAHDRGHERAQALCGDTERPPAGLPAVRGVSQAIP